MKNIIYLFISICLLAMTSCTKELPIPDVDADPVLVMNGLLSPETGVNIHISQSCHLADQNCNQKNIENAKVVLKDAAGNHLVDLTHMQQGMYTADGYQVEHNKTYMIEASSAGFETIKATGNTPKSFDCSLIENDEEFIHQYITRSVEVEIEDNPNEENYYLINGWIEILNGEHYDYENSLNGYIIPHTGFVTNDINTDNSTMIAPEDIYPYPLDYIFLKDESFNGETYRLHFGMHEEDVNEPHYELQAHVKVKSVSKELYDYYKSVTLHKLNAGSAFSEPEQVLSNIEKGLGIFGAYTEQEFIFDLPKSEMYLPEDIIAENAGCTGPCTVKFSADMGSKLIPFWDFGDGSTSTEHNPEHEYQSPGNYEVLLNIKLGGDAFKISRNIDIF